MIIYAVTMTVQVVEMNQIVMVLMDVNGILIMDYVSVHLKVVYVLNHPVKTV